MSLGPEKIILILVVALIVFGPHRLPDIARQVGGMMRELRRMQDTVRDELEHVLHPDFSPPSSSTTTPTSVEASTTFDTNHAVLPPSQLPPGSTGSDFSSEDVADDGFAGPRTFS
jgi:sec-independent protein translocase protein TatB